MTRRALVIGDALIDEVRDTGSVGRHPGGAALNLAVGMSILNVPTTLAAIVGADADGDVLERYLSGHGVELIATRGPYGTGIAVSDRTESEPAYEFSTAVVSRAFDFDFRLMDASAHAGLVAVNCFPLDNPDQVELLHGMLSRTRGLVALDPNPRPKLLHDSPAFRRGFERIAAAADIVKLSTEDAALLYGADADSVTQRLLDAGTGVVMVTAGRDGGSIALADGRRFTSPIAHLPGPIVDTMGGGDATLASLLAGLAATAGSSPVRPDGHDWQELLDRAQIVAAATCRHMGATLATDRG